MPVFAGAGRSTMSTFLPVCNPTPVARMVFFKVRCRSMNVNDEPNRKLKGAASEFARTLTLEPPGYKPGKFAICTSVLSTVNPLVDAKTPEYPGPIRRLPRYRHPPLVGTARRVHEPGSRRAHARVADGCRLEPTNHPAWEPD